MYIRTQREGSEHDGEHAARPKGHGAQPPKLERVDEPHDHQQRREEDEPIAALHRARHTRGYQHL